MIFYDHLVRKPGEQLREFVDRFDGKYEALKGDGRVRLGALTELR